LAWYLLAKVFEIADHAVLDLSVGLVSGHTLKHVAAAAVVLPLLRSFCPSRWSLHRASRAPRGRHRFKSHPTHHIAHHTT